MKAGIYTRLSEDPNGTSTATARQRLDCLELATQRGIEVIDEYEDEDLSAFQPKVRRLAFERMLGDMATGRIDTVIAWRSDRFARQSWDLERFLKVAEPAGGQFVSVTEPEFTGRTGLLILRMLIAFANHESGVKSERVARKIREQAEAGMPRIGGKRPFGYTAQYEPHPTEAPLYREAVDRVLAGERPRAVCRDWIQRGVLTVTGAEWRLSNFVRMLRAPSHAGIREHHGRLIDGTWEPLVERERWERMQALLHSPSHQGYSRTVTKHFLTGILFCQRCTRPMAGAKTRQVSGGRYNGREPVVYRCRPEHHGCGRVSINAERVEAIVKERFLHVASTATFASLVAGRSVGKGDATLTRLREDESALAQLTKDHYVERSITRPAFMAAKDALDERILVARRTLAQEASAVAAAPLGDPDALRQEWDARGVAWRRSVLEACVQRIVIDPAPAGKRGPSWWSDRVHIEWLV